MGREDAYMAKILFTWGQKLENKHHVTLRPSMFRRLHGKDLVYMGLNGARPGLENRGVPARADPGVILRINIPGGN
jgi:hypothetical protein